MKILYILFLFIINIFNYAFCEWYTISHDGILRNYYLSIPSDMNSDNPAPLIINLHGYGGNATQQLYYSEMNEYALEQNIAVVYPQGLNNSWNVYTYWDTNNFDDVGFINEIIEEIISNYNIDSDRIYACGMSNGGYMSYRLACDLSDKIVAFGSVTGNFMLNPANVSDCSEQGREIPIIHLHGTYDNIVNYYSPTFDGSLSVQESIDYWREFNNLTHENIETINNFVEIYTYSKEASNTKFIHYKVYGGGHEWFKNNWGFHSSEELIKFFLNYKLTDFIDSPIHGDLNGDNIINVSDIILLIDYILNFSSPDFNSADLNNDGELNILDITLLIMLILSD